MADTSAEDIATFFRVRKTIFQMLHDRGYDVPMEQRRERKEDLEDAWKKAIDRGSDVPPREQLKIVVGGRRGVPEETMFHYDEKVSIADFLEESRRTTGNITLSIRTRPGDECMDDLAGLRKDDYPLTLLTKKAAPAFRVETPPKGAEGSECPESAACAGDFTAAGIHNDRAKYTNPQGAVMYWDSSVWRISSTGDTSKWCYQPSPTAGILEEPLVGKWPGARPGMGDVKLGDIKAKDIVVYFFEDMKIGVKHVKYLGEEEMKKQGIKQSILVHRNGISGIARKAVSMYPMEDFNVNELITNVTEHDLVPRHLPLTQQKKRELLAKYGLQDSQLPRLNVTDPVAKYLGVKRGDVVKIIRPSETAGKYVTYRLVV